MLSIAAIALAAVSAASSAPLTATSPWWERITLTVSGDGSRQSCQYEMSLAGAPRSCEADEMPTAARSAPAGRGGMQTKITFERRFTPGERPDAPSLQPGDTLLGGHVMRVAITGDGAVQGCQVVAASGEATPTYGCDDVRAERFQASAGAGGVQRARTGFLTVLVYGHQEQVA